MCLTFQLWIIGAIKRQLWSRVLQSMNVHVLGPCGAHGQFAYRISTVNDKQLVSEQCSDVNRLLVVLFLWTWIKKNYPTQTKVLISGVAWNSQRNFRHFPWIKGGLMTLRNHLELVACYFVIFLLFLVIVSPPCRYSDALWPIVCMRVSLTQLQLWFSLKNNWLYCKA